MIERIFRDKDAVDKLEEEVIIKNHIHQYMLARRFVWGEVLDIACGCGYGSYLLSKNPDVEMVIGVDFSKEAIDHANKHYKDDNVSFRCCELRDQMKLPIDVLVSLETIEHLRVPEDFSHMIERVRPREIIVSHPRFKTTHFNSHHLWDIETSDIIRLLEPYYLLVFKEALLSSYLLRFVRTKEHPKTLPKRL